MCLNDNTDSGYLVTYNTKKKAKEFAKKMMNNRKVIEVQLKKV